MKITVLACPNHGALEAELINLMRQHSGQSTEGAVLIVPDQSSFSEEEKLISAFGVVGLGNPEVISFKRLFYKLSTRYPSGRKRLTAPAREMAVMHSLSDIDPEDFRLFRGVIKKRELSSAVSGLITGFKRYGVTAEKLRLCAEGLAENSPLQKKVHDCFKALESYNRFLSESGLSDADDDMTELARILNLNECDFFEGKSVFISRFSDLNRVQMECVEGICRRAERLFAAVVWEDRPEFAITKKLINGYKRIAAELGAEFELKILNYTDIRPEPLAYLSANYYGGAGSYDKIVDRSIFLHASKTPADEVRHAAAAITRLVKNGCRYRDITVAVRSMEDYAPYIKRIFPIYSIPVFADAKRPLAGHSASRYLLSALELAIYGFTHENVFTFAKNPFAPHGGDCGVLEDYCVEAGIRSWNWKEDFTFERGAYSSLDYGGEARAEDLTLINERRRELFELIEPLRICLSEKRSGIEFARGLYDFIVAGKLPENAERAAALQEENGDMRGAAETRQVYNLLMDILDDICTVFGESVIDSGDLYEAVKTACGAVQVGVVPPVTDSVVFGDIERMKGGRDRYVFVLGLNEDLFPRAFGNNSIFSDYETETLREEWDIELPPAAVEKAENEKLIVYDALSFAEERLYLSYSMGLPDGRNLRPSSVIKRVKELLPKLRETEDINPIHDEYLCATREAAFLELGTALGEKRPGKFWSMIYSLLAEDPDYGPKLRRLEEDRGRSSIDTETLDPELLKKITGDELALSPSRLETYGGCPFSYFIQYILKLRERTPMNINFADSGNMLHNIIDGFCARVEADKKGDWTKVDDEYTELTFNRVCGEIRRGISRQIAEDPRLMTAVKRIENAARKCIEEIREQVTQELFVPVGGEVIIGEGGKIKPMYLDLPFGGRARFTGRIDRTDKRTALITDEDGVQRMAELVRIIDYKSSKKELDFGKVLHGLQLQLFAYMDSYTSENPQSRPAGVLYFTLAPTMTELPIGEEMPPRVGRLTGVAVEGRMEGDKDIETISPKQMKTVLNFVRKRIYNAAVDISSGKIPVSPVRVSGSLNCDYCPCISICRFDLRGKESCVRDVPKMKAAEAIELME